MTVKARIPQTKKPERAERTRRERRVLLPSNRVAVWALPNVGEFLDLRTEALKKSDPNGGGDIEFGVQFGKLLLRKCLIGLTAKPVPSVWKAGFDVAAVRAKAEAEGVADIDAVVVAAEDAAEDCEAMKAQARTSPVNDFVWDEQDGEVGAYLAAIQTAEMDTVEAADWRALNDYATIILPGAMKVSDGPKAKQPRIRPLR